MIGRHKILTPYRLKKTGAVRLVFFGYQKMAKNPKIGVILVIFLKFLIIAPKIDVFHLLMQLLKKNTTFCSYNKEMFISFQQWHNKKQ